jgi:AraC-like DNA-binding protein
MAGSRIEGGMPQRYTSPTMIALRTALPGPPLREFVRVFAQREVHPFDSGTGHVVEPVPARLEQLLEFQFGNPYTVHHSLGHDLTTPRQAVIGAQVGGCASIELKPGIISFAVFFQPAGLSRLFSIPVREMSHRNYDAALVCRQIPALRDRVGECLTFEARVGVMEDFLTGMAARVRGKETMIAVAEQVFSLHGIVGSIPQLAAKTGLGSRQFERQFLRQVGMPPKLFARVARFQTALDAKIAAPARTWLEIAHRLHYHDQMHMIRDFQLLAGDTPKQLLAQIGDARPGALAPGAGEKKLPKVTHFY